MSPAVHRFWLWLTQACTEDVDVEKPLILAHSKGHPDVSQRLIESQSAPVIRLQGWQHLSPQYAHGQSFHPAPEHAVREPQHNAMQRPSPHDCSFAWWCWNQQIPQLARIEMYSWPKSVTLVWSTLVFFPCFDVAMRWEFVKSTREFFLIGSCAHQVHSCHSPGTVSCLYRLRCTLWLPLIRLRSCNCRELLAPGSHPRTDCPFVWWFQRG